MMKTNLSTISGQNEAGLPSLSRVATDSATIDKSLEVKGEVIGSELYIDGKIMGTIFLPGSGVTVGRHERVSADICAREVVVVLGTVHGNIDASDRVNISSEGSLTGNVITQRVSVAEGAFFKGVIEIHTPL
jgi:cytoskeletal protein CcmA (bactofilin family)